MVEAWNAVHNEATILLASVMLMIVLFLIARVAHARQGFALTLAFTPALLAVTVERSLSMGLI
jgi:hypothetical protein